MKFNKILTAIAGAALLAGAWSCTDKTEYTPAPAYDGDEVYFSQEDEQDVPIKVDATQVSVNVYRNGGLDKELTVGIDASIVDEEGEPTTAVFSPATQVTFPAGSNVAELVIGVTFSAVTPEENYVLTAKIAGEAHTPYGLTERTYTLSYAPWGEYERYKDPEFGTVTLSLFGISDKEVAVYKAKSLINDSVRFQFGDAYCPELNDVQATWTYYVNGYHATVIADSVHQRAVWEPMPTGDENSFGSMVMVTDAYTYVSQINPAAIPDGATAENFLNTSRYLPDRGLFGFNTIYYIEGRMVGQQAEYMQLPGFADYGIEVRYLGNMYYNNLEEEAAKVNVYRTDDLASYAYRLEKGALTEDEVKAVLADMLKEESPELVYDQQLDYEFFLREEGPYTLVFTGYDDAGENVFNTYYTFGYEPSVPYTWRTLGYAEYTDGFVYSLFTSIPAYTWDVLVEQSTVDPNVLRLVNPYKFGNGWPMADATYDNDGNDFVYINIETSNCVYIASGSRLGVQLSSSDGYINVYSQAGEYVEGGARPAQVARLGYGGTIDENQVITFPASTLLGQFTIYNPDSWLNTNLNMDIAADDYVAQRKTIGSFYLDLGAFNLGGTGSANVKQKYPVRRLTKAQSKANMLNGVGRMSSKLVPVR